MPYVTHWLTHALAARRIALAICEKTGRDLLPILTEQNVLMQLVHLKTHPHVAGALARQELTISGWIYDIGSGEVRICQDGSCGEFESISPGVPPR
jgi:carbonic anhydrase